MFVWFLKIYLDFSSLLKTCSCVDTLQQRFPGVWLSAPQFGPNKVNTDLALTSPHHRFITAWPNTTSRLWKVRLECHKKINK